MGDQLIESFKAAYGDLMCADLAALDRIYAGNVEFRDPIHRLNGLPALQDYLAASLANVQECRFEFLDQLCADQVAYIKWNMHFRHPRLAGGERLSVRGMSQLLFTDRIYFHEDSYDMGQMLYEHLPLVGGLTRWLRGRLAS